MSHAAYQLLADFNTATFCDHALWSSGLYHPMLLLAAEVQLLCTIQSTGFEADIEYVSHAPVLSQL